MLMREQKSKCVSFSVTLTFDERHFLMPKWPKCSNICAMSSLRASRLGMTKFSKRNNPRGVWSFTTDKKKKKGTRMKRNSMQGNEGRMPPVTHSITCAHGLHKRSNSLKRNPGFSFPHSSGCSMQHGLSFTYILPWRINHECDVCWEVMHLPGSNRAQIIIWHVFGVDRWGRKKIIALMKSAFNMMLVYDCC